MKKLLMWALYLIILTILIVPIEIVSYYGEVRFAAWLADKLGIN